MAALVVCFVVHPFNAVYVYTPSKLPSTAAPQISTRPAEQTADDSQKSVVMQPMLCESLSVSDAEAASVGSADRVDLATSVSNVDGIGIIEAYSQWSSESLDGSVAADRAAVTACTTQTGIRRSCSLDGAALAYRCHSDDAASDCGAAVYSPRSHSSGDSDWCSQGN